MIFILEYALIFEGINTLPTLFFVSGADTGINFDAQIKPSPIVLSDLSLIFISCAALFGVLLGVLATIFFTKSWQQGLQIQQAVRCSAPLNHSNTSLAMLLSKIPRVTGAKLIARNKSNRISPAYIADMGENQNYSRNLSLSHVNKSWICQPLLIILEQLSLLSNETVKIKFTNNISDAHKLYILVCPRWFAKVIEELVSNACKHNDNTADLNIMITIFLQDEYLALMVSDNGIGICEKTAATLMKPSSSRNSRLDNIYGLLEGPINLSNIRSLLQQSGGSLDISSARQFLTKVTLRVPFVNKPQHHANTTKLTAHNSNSCAQPIQHSERLKPFYNVSANLNVVNESTKEPYSNDTNFRLQVEDCISAYKRRLKMQSDPSDLESCLFADSFNRVLLAHYSDESSNKTRAAQCMLMTSKTLTRRLHRHYRSGFVETLRKFRLHQAITLLMNGETVTSVAFDSGFSSASYFAQCFRIEFGFAPSLLTK